MDANALALAELLVRIGPASPSLRAWERRFLDGIGSRLYPAPGGMPDAMLRRQASGAVTLSARQMALLRAIAVRLDMPDSNTIWIERIVRFSLELEHRAVDSVVIGQCLAAAWPHRKKP